MENFERKQQFLFLPKNMKATFNYFKVGAILFFIFLFLIGSYYFSLSKRISRLENQLQEAVKIMEQLEKVLAGTNLKEASKNLSIKNGESVSNYNQETKEIGDPNLKDFLIKAIRIGDHPDFSRIVFDLEDLNGKDLNSIPKTKASWLDKEKVILVEIFGFTGDLAKNADFGKEIKAKSNLITSYKSEKVNEGVIRYLFSVNKEAGFLLDSRLSPSRIVIDIKAF
jgi:hypothetical protein